MVFPEILLRIYLNITKSIYEILTKKYTHGYSLNFFHHKCLSHAYRLMYMFLCRTQSIMYLEIYAEFVPDKDYDSRCFKIINTHYLK